MGVEADLRERRVDLLAGAVVLLVAAVGEGLDLVVAAAENRGVEAETEELHEEGKRRCQ